MPQLPVPEVVSRLQSRRRQLTVRARLRRALRSWFDDRDWLEVETPVRIAAPAPEEYIETIPAAGAFLRPSPELEMKNLLAAGYESIYQLGACFRADEFGRKHRTEFTMLEYYRAGISYRDLAHLTAVCLRDCAREVLGSPRTTYRGKPLNFSLEPEFITVREAFARWTPMTMQEADKHDCFDDLMVAEIEPRLGQGRLTFLTDYPANRASLARLKADEPEVAERWELYIYGLELANAYGELRDCAEQRARFDAAVRFRREHGLQDYPEPDEFYQALAYGLPPVSGCALGFDRLAMIFADTDDIADVRCE